MISSTTSYLSIPAIKGPTELPPTPSSSYCHSVASRESRFSTLVGRQTDGYTLSSSSSSRLAVPKQYGSFLNMPLSGMPLSAPPTPLHTTIGSDEGLYLLWTQQLLREQGYRPYSCRQDDTDDDDDDDESSQSDTSIISPYYSTIDPPTRRYIHTLDILTG
ncbi:hypothetical protein BC941DRAFT_515557 [Chlamydoabsidia padenii]|nr:hypothetical protein BC941DRAFT_515557 [Chlamydoabsidia padenii]